MAYPLCLPCINGNHVGCWKRCSCDHAVSATVSAFAFQEDGP